MLRRHLPGTGRVLEVAAGAGEHALFFSAALPALAWRPTDGDPDAVAVLAQRRETEGSPNLLPPLRLDASDPDNWSAQAVDPPPDAIVCINMIHIAPWAAAAGLFTGAGRVLSPGGVLILYGPYREADVPTAPSNEAFDASLKGRNAAWGLRDLAAVDGLAAAHRLARIDRVEMPANNLTIVYRREAP